MFNFYQGLSHILYKMSCIIQDVHVLYKMYIYYTRCTYIIQDVHILYKMYIYYTRCTHTRCAYVHVLYRKEVHVLHYLSICNVQDIHVMWIPEKFQENVACTYKVCTVQNIHVVYSVLHRMFCVLYMYSTCTVHVLEYFGSRKTCIPGSMYCTYLNAVVYFGSRKTCIPGSKSLPN